ncbi:alpha/beta hydrolase [Sphingomonas sp. BK235]|uniref:alpha/beta fold hydrolase n=1 Tax=Sphingomonas sp. BK235 TaxID=2512131 RepID=UPI0010443411|nr:alpha/beta hydrolase [Sphingomonas sp. BK235]
MIDPAVRRLIPTAARVDIAAAADGWPLRRFLWPGGTRGTILFQAGRGDMFEKYLETFAYWQAAGWTVAAFDWRGQGGSGRLCADPAIGHCGDFAPWLADLAAQWRDWITPLPAPHVIVGHSMGGYLALRALLDGAVQPRAAVLVAPMLGLASPVGAWLGGRAARLMRRLGDPARAAWRGERPGLPDRRRLLTGDADRYADEGWWYEAEPTLRLGPPSWAWLDEAFAATARLRADPALTRLDVPVLLLVADHDRLVDARAAHRVAARLPRATLVRFGEEAAHELLRERDAVRDRALAAIDSFLAEQAA